MHTADQSFIERLDLVVDQRLPDPDYSTDDLCREMGVSRSLLFRVLKEQTGLSPSLYIRHRRMLKARHLLLTTNLRIVEVSEQTGITSPQNFTKYFTEQFEVSPSAVRRNGLRNEGPEAASIGRADVDDSTTEELAPPTSAPDAAPPRPNRLPGWRPWRYPLLAALGLAVVGLLAAYRTGMLRLSAPSENSIAILPFRSLGTPQTQYFSEGVVEQIQTSLTLIKPLKVISRTSTLPYAETTKPVAQIARELGVNYIMEGSVLQLGNRLKLSVELIQAGENRTVWAKTYEGEVKDVFTFTSEVARTVADELNQKISQLIRQRLDEVPTRSPAAYTEYLKGQYLMRTRTKEGLEKSLINYDRALSLDSTFAEVYAGKAMVYFLFGTETYKEVTPNLKLAEKNALMAIRIDAESAMAYAILAKIYQYQNKWEQANTTFQIALRYRPNDALITYWYSLLLRSIGQLDQAIAYSTKAVNLDPLYPVILIGHVCNLAYAGRFDEARQVIEEGDRLHQSVYSWYWAKGFYYLCRHQNAEALNVFERGCQLNSNSVSMQVQVAYMKARMGKPEQAQALLQSIPDIADNYPDKATLCAGLGDTEGCLTYLEKGAEAGLSPNYLKVSPIFAFLKNNPRYRTVLQKLGLGGPMTGR